jgi:hypothetical protein
LQSAIKKQLINYLYKDTKAFESILGKNALKYVQRHFLQFSAASPVLKFIYAVLECVDGEAVS